MILLALDTSSHICSACLYDCDGDKLLAKQSIDIGRGHAEVLMGLIENCLADAELTFKDLSRIGVTVGPGSFTGVRVGMSVARGLGLSLDLPVIGISTLEACEAEVSQHDGSLISLLDAKRGELYFKISDQNSAVASYEALHEILKGQAISACGAGALILNEKTDLDLPVLHSYSAPNIETVAKLIAKMPIPTSSPEPLYLRSADAKVQAGFALERA